MTPAMASVPTLRLAARDPRVLRDGRRPGPEFAARGTWAAAIASRYLGRFATNAWLERILLRSPRDGHLRLRPERHASMIEFAPRVTVNVLRPLVHQLSSVRTEVRPMIRTEREWRPTLERTSSAPVVERLLARTTRHEVEIVRERASAESLTPLAGSARAQPSSPEPDVLPLESVPRVFRREKPTSPAPSAARAGDQAEAVARDGARTPAGLPRTTAAPPTLPPVLLNRITEHVLAAIDRRITSNRERRGLR